MVSIDDFFLNHNEEKHAWKEGIERKPLIIFVSELGKVFKFQICSNYVWLPSKPLLVEFHL